MKGVLKLTYQVYDSSPSSYYQNYIWTSDDWVTFDISDTTTIVLIGSYNYSDYSISGNTKQVVTIVTSNYGNTPNITIQDVDNREDTVNFSPSLGYRMYSNVDAPLQKNTTYETSYTTSMYVFDIFVVLIIAFLFCWIKGVLPWTKSN